MLQKNESEYTNQYYITRQDSTESNARSYPRKFPFALAKAQGSWIEDVEGNKYIDYCLAYGPMAMGHANNEIIKNVQTQLEKGTGYGAPTENEIKFIKSWDLIKNTSSIIDNFVKEIIPFMCGNKYNEFMQIIKAGLSY